MKGQKTMSNFKPSLNTYYHRLSMAIDMRDKASLLALKKDVKEWKNNNKEKIEASDYLQRDIKNLEESIRKELSYLG